MTSTGHPLRSHPGWEACAWCRPRTGASEADLSSLSLPDDDDLDFARETLGPDATDDEVMNLANLRLDRDEPERSEALSVLAGIAEGQATPPDRSVFEPVLTRTDDDGAVLTWVSTTMHGEATADVREMARRAAGHLAKYQGATGVFTKGEMNDRAAISAACDHNYAYVAIVHRGPAGELLASQATGAGADFEDFEDQLDDYDSIEAIVTFAEASIQAPNTSPYRHDPRFDYSGILGELVAAGHGKTYCIHTVTLDDDDQVTGYETDDYDGDLDDPEWAAIRAAEIHDEAQG